MTELPCGGKAYRDPDSSIHAMRCDSCFAVVGSIGMPDRCKKLYKEKKVDDMINQYTVSGTGHILKNGKVLERQDLNTPQDAAAKLLNDQSKRIAKLERQLELATHVYQDAKEGD